MICPGLYRHYKGMYYQVIEIAKHSESLESYVVYRALYGDHGLWIRPLSMFIEDVEVHHRIQKRFRFISEKVEIPG